MFSVVIYGEYLYPIEIYYLTFILLCYNPYTNILFNMYEFIFVNTNMLFKS